MTDEIDKYKAFERREDLKTHIALLERDISQMNMFVEKLDSAIEKLAEVSSSIKELLVVHDHKLTRQAEVNKGIYDLIQEMKEENHNEHEQTKKQIILLADRISSLERWKYTVVGGAVVVGFLLSHISNLIH